MKHPVLSLLMLVLLITPGIPYAQNDVIYPTAVNRAFYFDISPPLRDIVPIPPEMADRTWKTGVVKNFLGLRKPDTSAVSRCSSTAFYGKMDCFRNRG